jgi:hypothetical protein
MILTETLQRAFSGILIPAYDSKATVPKAACDPENCSESRQGIVHFRGFFMHLICDQYSRKVEHSSKNPKSKKKISAFIKKVRFIFKALEKKIHLMT